MYIPPFDKDQFDKTAMSFVAMLERNWKELNKAIETKYSETGLSDLKNQIKELQQDEEYQRTKEVKEEDLKKVLDGLDSIWQGNTADKVLSEVLIETIRNFLPDTQEIEMQGTYEAKTYFEGSTQPSVVEFEAYLDGYQAGAKYIIGGLVR